MKVIEKRPPARPAGEQGGDAVEGQDWYWADPKSLKVNPAFEALIPLQSKGEYMALDQSIQAEGCRDPLTVWKGKNVVLDGHTRRMLCAGHKKQVKVREVDLADEQAAVEYILQIQRERRNLTREAMSYFRGTEYNALKRQRGGSKRGRKPKGFNQPQPTSMQVADKYGVAEKTIRRDGQFAQDIDQLVVDYGQPEVKRKLLGADVKMTPGTARVLLKMPAEERKKAMDHLIEFGELPRAHKAGEERDRAEQRPRRVAKRLLASLEKKGEVYARAVVNQLVRLLGLQVVDPAAGK
jgi:hypothetical protein